MAFINDELTIFHERVFCIICVTVRALTGTGMVSIVWCLAICQLWRAKWMIWWGNRGNILFCINDWLATSLLPTFTVLFPMSHCTAASTSIGGSVWQQAETFCNISRYFFCCGSVRCIWFVYGPADATATVSSLASVKSTMVLPFWCQLIKLSWNKGR